MIYKGPITYSKMPDHLIRAAKSYYSQIHRCTNPKCSSYPKYGGKGIRVRYSVREFIGWWDREYQKKQSWKCATLSRVDHDKDYDFSNIVLEEKSKNTTERNKRVKNSSLRKKVKSVDRDGNIKIFNSVYKAYCYHSVPRRSLIDLLQMKYGKNQRNNIKFEYHKGA